LVKSADVLANYSELVDDYNRYGDETFSRFNASKEEIIIHQLKVISAIVTRWADNPLYRDLVFLADKLRTLGLNEFMEKYPAEIIDIGDFKRDMKIKCPICDWEGTPESSDNINTDSSVALDVRCPICDKMILVAEYEIFKSDSK